MASKTKSKASKTPPAAAPSVERVSKYVDPAALTVGPNSRDMNYDPDYPSKVQALAVSIFQNGQEQPASAFTNVDGKDVIFAGHTRAAAVSLIRAGFDAVDPTDGEKKRFHNPDQLLWIAVDPTARTLAQAYLNSVTENFSRNELNPIQEAVVYETLRAEPFNYSDTRIANTFGRENTNRVSKLRAIREGLSVPFQGMVERGELAVYPAFDLLQVPAEERAALLAKAKSERDDGSTFYDGSVIRNHLQGAASAAAEQTGPADGDEGDGEDSGGESAPAAPKRNAKDLEKLIQSCVDGSEVDDETIAVLKKLKAWFACKCGDQSLLNALAAYAGSLSK